MKLNIYTLIVLFSFLILSSCNSTSVDVEQPISNSDTIFLNNPNVDSLSKYTYPLIVFSNNIVRGNASSFFVRKNGKLLLVSNYHVFTSQNTARKEKASLVADSIGLTYVDNNNPVHVTIDVRSIGKKSKSYYFYEYPDLYIYDVTKVIPYNAAVHSIEKFISASFKADNPNDIVAYGFGKQTRETIGIPLKINFTLTDHPYDKFEFEYGFEGNRVILTNSYHLTTQSVFGMSGSPVFFDYKQNGRDSVMFGGVICSHQPISNLTTVVKPSELTKLLSKF